MEKNTRMWDAFSKPPVDALREIRGGRLRGKTDINPQWRLKAMTETFGPVGIGWKYTIDKLWLEPGNPPEVCAFALVSVSVNEQGVWSEPVPGCGGSAFVTKEKDGIYTSDEAFKMAVTDALSVALKAFGVAAEVYLGNFEGTKYREPPEPEPVINEEDVARIEKMITDYEVNKDAFCAHFGIKGVRDLPKKDFPRAVRALEKKKKT